MTFTREVRLLAMLGLTGTMFLTELIVGYISGSIALIADSFHMLSDLLALLVAVYAVRMAKRKRWKPYFTYGWQRAEVLGALINGVFLLALCFIIFVEAVQRFSEIEEVKQPELVLIVGVVGLVINIIGLFLFHEHGHDHGGHDHHHTHDDTCTHDTPNSAATELSATEGKVLEDIKEQAVQRALNEIHANPFDHVTKYSVRLDDAPDGDANHSGDIAVNINYDNSGMESLPMFPLASGPNSVPTSPAAAAALNPKRSTAAAQPAKKMRNLNIHGVFLHVLGDALASVGVIISALIIWLTDWSWRYYVDPILSLLITFLILFSTVPLVRKACIILLQGTPESLPMEKVRSELLRLPNVLDLHELHVWQLSDTKIVASVHVHCANQADFMGIAASIKTLLHRYGIHSVTVQPEFVSTDASQQIINRRKSVSTTAATNTEPSDAAVIVLESGVGGDDNSCLLRCEDDSCATAECCPPDVVMEWSASGEQVPVNSPAVSSSSRRRRFNPFNRSSPNAPLQKTNI